MTPKFQDHSDTSSADAHLKAVEDEHNASLARLMEFRVARLRRVAPKPVDVPALPDTDQDGRAMLAIAAGAIIGGAVIVALYAWGWLL